MSLTELSHTIKTKDLPDLEYYHLLIDNATTILQASTTQPKQQVAKALNMSQPKFSIALRFLAAIAYPRSTSSN